MERDIVAPGDSVLLKITLSTKSYRSRIVKSPAIYTNADTLNGISHVRIIATVTPRTDTLTPIQVKPYKVDISQFGSTVRDSVSFTLLNVTNTPLYLKTVATPQKVLRVDLPTGLGRNQGANCLISLTELGKSVEFEESITFETVQPVITRYTIPVKRRIRESIGGTPETTCITVDSILDSL